MFKMALEIFPKCFSHFFFYFFFYTAPLSNQPNIIPKYFMTYNTPVIDLITVYIQYKLCSILLRAVSDVK